MGDPNNRKANFLVTGRGTPPEILTVCGSAGASSTATILAAPAAGKKIVGLSLILTTLATGAGLVELKNGAGGTVIWHGVPAAGAPIPDCCPAGGKLFELSAATLLQMANAGTGGTAYLTLRYILEDVPT